MNPTTEVQGAERLVEIFGGWPSFHDSEVLEFQLDRHGRDEFEGPVLRIRFHLFQGRRDAEAASGVSWYNHTQATLRFSNVCELEIGDFNNQNAISDLQFEDAGAHPHGSGVRAYRVTIQPSYGLGGSFLCGAIEVSEIQPGAPTGSVYSE